MDQSCDYGVAQLDNCIVEQSLPSRKKLTRKVVEDALRAQRNSPGEYIGIIAFMILAIVLGTFVFPLIFLFVVNGIIALAKMIPNDIKRKKLQHYVIDRPCIEKQLVQSDDQPDVWQLWFNNKDGDLNVAVAVEKDDYDTTELRERFYLVFAADEKIPCLWYRKKEWELDQIDGPPIW